MKKPDYKTSISVNTPVEEAFERITQVSEWWTKNFEGSSKKLNDVFTVRFGETFVTAKLTEVVKNKKILWHITDCNLHWIENKKEWKDTEVSFEISKNKNSTQIDFTHIGLKPDIECYNDCTTGWNQYVHESLLKLITEKKGLPDKF